MGRITPQRSYILLGKQRLGFSDWLYFILNGVIFVDRKDKDDMAAMRWAFWERNGLFSREELDLDAERQKLFYSVEEYPPIDWAYESSCIYHPHTEPEDVWQSVVNIKNVHAGNITHIIYAKKMVEREKKRDFQLKF